MDNLFFSNWESLIRVVITSALAYPAIIIILRVSGKRSLSKMNAFDFIVTIALGSIFASMILNKSVPLADGILAFVMLIIFQFLITYLSARSKRLSKLIKSAPRLLAYNGDLIKKNMLAERIDEDEIWQSLREKGYSSLDEASAVVLEANGNIIVIDKIEDIEAAPVRELIK